MLIRAANEADLPQMRAIYAPYVRETAISFEYRVPSEAEFAARFARITAHFPWLVAEEAGTVVGYAYGDLPFARDAYAWSAESSIYIHRDWRREGIGAALYAALEPQLAQLGFCTLYAIVTGENQNSVAFHERLGFQKVAVMPRVGYKFGRWQDTIWLMKILREGPPGPAPLPPADLKNC